MPELGHHAANERVTPAVPFQINGAMKISRTMDFRPTVRTARLFGPGFDKAKFLLQLRISRDLAAQRSAPGRDHLDHGLHRSVTLSKSAELPNFQMKIR